MKRMQTYVWALLPVLGFLWWQGQQQSTPHEAGPTSIPTARLAVIDTEAFSSDGGIQQLIQQRKILEGKFRKPIQDLQQLRQQIDALQQDIRTKGANWTVQTRQSKQEELQSKQIKAKRLAEDLDRQTKREQLRATTPIRERIQTLLQQFASRRGITIIVDAAPLRQVGALPYVSQTIDVTKDFINDYNKMYPVAPSAGAQSSQ